MKVVIEGTSESFAVDEPTWTILWSAMRELGMIVPIPNDVTVPDDIDMSTFETGAPGLPDLKMEIRGSLVTPLEIAEALVTADAQGPHVDAALRRSIGVEFRRPGGPLGDTTGPTRAEALIDVRERWDEWIGFLKRANEQGGFRVGR
jgi:hypothetical protein